MIAPSSRRSHAYQEALPLVLAEMIDRGVGRFGSAQRFARMTFLAAGLLA
jgi:hypothetical protein